VEEVGTEMTDEHPLFEHDVLVLRSGLDGAELEMPKRRVSIPCYNATRDVS
jgi:hypothetical protein